MEKLKEELEFIIQYSRQTRADIDKFIAMLSDDTGLARINADRELNIEFLKGRKLQAVLTIQLLQTMMGIDIEELEQ